MIAKQQRTGEHDSRFKPYQAYKDSGVEWLGEIPAHWEVKRLKYFVRVRADKLFEKPENLPYLGLENIESWTGRILLENQPESVDSTISMFKPGDVLFGKLRPYLAKAARIQFDGVCTTELLVLQPSLDCDQNYLFYSMLSQEFIRWIDSSTYGTKMPRASPEQVKNCGIGIPPLPEQQAIADFLDRETAKIDVLVMKKEKLIELLQEKRAALISHAVTKGLDTNVPMKDSGVEWLGEIPAHWEVKRLKTIASVQLGNVDKKSVEGQEPVLLCNYVDVYYNEYITADLDFMPATATPEQIQRFSLCAGDVLVTKDSETPDDIAVPAVVAEDLPGVICGYHLAHIRPMPLAVEGRFLAREFAALGPRDQFHAAANGITRFGLTGDVVCSAVFCLPPLPEQQAIANFLDRETAKIDALVAKIREGIGLLKEYRTALISAAVTGKIDVRSNGESKHLQDQSVWRA